ncbi:hypothetical protein WICMUC_003354, partial [Wickerhamomyces mucosus]
RATGSIDDDTMQTFPPVAEVGEAVESSGQMATSWQSMASNVLLVDLDFLDFLEDEVGL